MKKVRMAVLVLMLSVSAVAVDQKSLLLGVAIASGMLAVKGVVPVAKTVGHASKVAARGTTKGVKRAIRGPEKGN